MQSLESATIPLVEFTRIVYDTGELIPNKPLVYRDIQLNGSPIPRAHRQFHQLLVALSDANGSIPISLQQRYGLDPYRIYCLDGKDGTSDLQCAMRRAVVMLLGDLDIVAPFKESTMPRIFTKAG